MKNIDIIWKPRGEHSNAENVKVDCSIYKYYYNLLMLNCYETHPLWNELGMNKLMVVD